jgi:ubiquinone/menaquinone biosynthesis C-methylase UbiE
MGNPVFAALYDRISAGAERAGLADRRAELVAGAHGVTLELGAGTGLNLRHYPAAVTELVLTEPDRHMARRLRARVRDAGRPAEVVEAPAERLPFEDGRFETAVVTLVLCTVADPAQALREIARVLKPGGRLLFMEHVRATDRPRLARWQDRLERPWGWVGAGCHPNRDTVATIEASPLTVESLELGEFPKAPPLVKPLVAGVAARSGPEGPNA